MGPSFILKPTKSTSTCYLKYYFLKAADATFTIINNIYLPTFRLGIPTIHTEEVSSKQAGFITPSSSPDFHNDIPFIISILGQKSTL